MDQFRRYHCNIWVRGTNRWMNMDTWKRCGVPFTPEDLVGQECYAGLDLGSTNDLTALVLWFPGVKARILSYFWLPADNLQELEEQHSVPYGQWVDAEYIETTEGTRTNYDAIRARLNALRHDYQITEVRFDPYNASSLVRDLIEDGFTMVEYRQSVANMSPATKAFETCVEHGEMEHNNQPVMNWMMGNAQVKTDFAENVRLIKGDGKVKYKIDGAIAAIMAFSGATTQDSPFAGLAKSGVLFVGGK
jgi:phage terminase large subunit-like protein